MKRFGSSRRANQKAWCRMEKQSSIPSPISIHHTTSSEAAKQCKKSRIVRFPNWLESHRRDICCLWNLTRCRMAKQNCGWKCLTLLEWGWVWWGLGWGLTQSFGEGWSEFGRQVLEGLGKWGAGRIFHEGKLSSQEGKPLQTRYTSTREAVMRSMMGAMKPMASQE